MEFYHLYKSPFVSAWVSTIWKCLIQEVDFNHYVINQ